VKRVRVCRIVGRSRDHATLLRPLPPPPSSRESAFEGGRLIDQPRVRAGVINATCQSAACVSLLISLTSFHIARSSRSELLIDLPTIYRPSYHRAERKVRAKNNSLAPRIERRDSPLRAAPPHARRGTANNLRMQKRDSERDPRPPFRDGIFRGSASVGKSERDQRGKFPRISVEIVAIRAAALARNETRFADTKLFARRRSATII